jgi:hypothetical protein
MDDRMRQNWRIRYFCREERAHTPRVVRQSALEVPYYLVHETYKSFVRPSVRFRRWKAVAGTRPCATGVQVGRGYKGKKIPLQP